MSRLRWSAGSRSTSSNNDSISARQLSPECCQHSCRARLHGNKAEKFRRGQVFSAEPSGILNFMSLSRTCKRTRSGERPYACNEPDCDYQATQAGNFKTHTRTHGG
ncbi:hypothetical protein T492DRAFT_234220 [Pavlovales sp. CCMP2436]|nr:hypothetical protein T492DRAFT_234220 [Pavlovales sp. CCMP2436]